MGPFIASFAPLIAFGRRSRSNEQGICQRQARRSRQHRREVQNDPMYDFGADTSLRASFAQTSFMHYYQKTDADFENKVVERKGNFLTRSSGFLTSTALILVTSTKSSADRRVSTAEF